MRRLLVVSIVLGIGAVVLAVAAAVVAVADGDVRIARPATATTTVPRGPLVVSGLVTTVSAEEASSTPLASPLTVHVPARGEGSATIVQVTIGGRGATVAWDGGRPLVMEGGTLDVGITRFEAVAGVGLRWLLDGEPRRLSPGIWSVRTPVAVGREGETLAAPRDGVRFTAGDASLLQTKGGAFLLLPSASTTVEGAGSVHLEGDFVVGGRKRRVADIAAVRYRLQLTEVAGGFRIAGEIEEPHR